MNDESQAGEGWSGAVGSSCPVQGWGTLDGREWYFRADGDAWSFTVGHEFQHGRSCVDAGYMSPSFAWGLIREAIALYRAQRV